MSTKTTLLKRTPKITIRRKPISKERFSLFLDYYPAVIHPTSGKPIRKEYLGLFIYGNPLTTTMKLHNQQTIEHVKNIVIKRYRLLFENRNPIKDKNQPSFLSYFYKQAYAHDHRWLVVYRYFKAFQERHGLAPEYITANICEEFKIFLSCSPSLRSEDKRLSPESARKYYLIFTKITKGALKEGIIASESF